MHENQKWGWGEEQQVAFETLKRALCSAPVLARPDFSRQIQCDASGVALGAVLTQENEVGEEHPIVYLSRTLDQHEKNYAVSEKKLLAVLWSIEKLHPYVEGYHFTVVTDHSALKWLRNLKDPTGRLYKVSQHAEVGLMDRREIEEPWSDVSAVLMEFPQSKSRNKYLIFFEDLFTRWVEGKPVPNATGIVVQKALEDLVVFRWGTPRRLIVDNGSEFDNKRIAEMVKCYGIDLFRLPRITTEQTRRSGVIVP